MKSLFTLMISFTVLFATSCNKLEEALQSDLSTTPKEVEFSIPVLTASNTEVTYKEIGTTINLDSLIKVTAPSFGEKNIKSIKLTNFTIDFLNSDNANNFANLQSINAKIETAGKSALEIVSITNNPDVTSASLSIPLSAEGLELKDYLSNKTIKYILKGKVRRSTTKILQAKAKVNYTITVGL